MNIIVGCLAFVALAGLVLASLVAPPMPLIPAPVFVAVAAASFGWFEPKSPKLLMGLAMAGLIGAVAAIVFVFAFARSDEQMIMLLLSCGGFLAATLLSFKLYEAASLQAAHYEDVMRNVGNRQSEDDLKNLDD